MPISLSPTRTYLQADGKPFFWLADTCWNGVLKATDEEWETYLRTRAEQGFTVIQFVCTQWRAYEEEQGFTLDPLTINEAFFAKRDRLVQMIREHGLVPAPVMLWGYNPTDPGGYLSEDDAYTVASYIRDRWDDDPVAWILGGDGHYQGDKAEKWQRLGRRLFPTSEEPSSEGPSFSRPPPPIVTMHPCGQSWVVSEFRHEPWFSFHGYQSGHGDAAEHLWWLINGPPGQPWQTEPVHPVINLEPNYETHITYHSKRRITPHEVRRAAYWSLLVAPTAGVTYGNNSIWWWGREPSVPLGHDGLGVVDPWQAGLDLPGIRHMTVMRGLFESLPWWELRPALQLLAAQPGAADPTHYVMAAATPDGSVAVVYAPLGATLELDLSSLQTPLQAQWFDPRTGAYTDAAEPFTTPDDDDWVLLIKSS